MESTTRLIMQLMKFVLNAEEGIEIPSCLCLEESKKLFKLAKSHDMAHFVGYAIKMLGIEIPVEIQYAFQKEQVQAVYRYEQQNYELEQVCGEFEKAEIPFIPLKGSVIRTYYPEPWLRTSCDIDILVAEKDLDRASQILQQALGYKIGDKGSHDISFKALSGVHLELHYVLIEECRFGKMGKLFDNVWDFSSPATGKQYHRIFNKEIFYYYHIAHMAKHYLIGGCGLRPFMDLYILNEQQFLSKDGILLLQEGGLWKFAEQAAALSNVWFRGGTHTSITQQMEDYLLKGGIYGNTSNRVAIRQVKMGGKGKYFWSRIFLPYDIIKYSYPILQKHRWLTPFMQVHRWFKLIFCGHAKRAIHEIKCSNDISLEETMQMQEFLNNIGL